MQIISINKLSAGPEECVGTMPEQKRATKSNGRFKEGFLEKCRHWYDILKDK